MKKFIPIAETKGCAAVGCPTVLAEEDCGIGACHGVYRKDGDALVIGILLSPAEVDLAKKVGPGEALVRLPARLIAEAGRKLAGQI